MSTVVIGGHSRSVGKTSVVAGLIAALPAYNWTALKITQYGHNVCSANGAPCDCATADHSVAISEEKDRSGDSDTSRFLVAGADHACIRPLDPVGRGFDPDGAVRRPLLPGADGDELSVNLDDRRIVDARVAGELRLNLGGAHRPGVLKKNRADQEYD